MYRMFVLVCMLYHLLYVDLNLLCMLMLYLMLMMWMLCMVLLLLLCDSLLLLVCMFWNNEIVSTWYETATAMCKIALKILKKLVSDHLLISLSFRYFTHEKMLIYLMLLTLNMALMFCKINATFPVNCSSDEWNFVILFDIVKLRNSNYRICIKITDWSNKRKHIWTAQWIFNCLEKDSCCLFFVSSLWWCHFWEFEWEFHWSTLSL